MTDALPTGDPTQNKFFIGPSGWSYDDRVGTVYPRRPPRGFAALTFLADYFDAVEVNVSFYRLVPPSMAEAFPELKAIACPPSDKFPESLF